MLTRPVAPAVLRLLSRVVSSMGSDGAPAATVGELMISGQLLAFTARRLEHEPAFILEETLRCEALAELLLEQRLGDAAAIATALAQLRAHRALGVVELHDAQAYSLASEILCLAVDATFDAPGPAREAMSAALEQRLANQKHIVGDFAVVGR